MSPETLIKACIAGDADAVREFMRRYHADIRITVSRTARRWKNTTPETIDDLIQETYLKLWESLELLLAKIQPDRPDAFAAYLKVTSANLVRDHFRAVHAGRRNQDKEESLDGENSEEPVSHGSGDGDIERELLIGEIEDVLRRREGSSVERDLQVFGYHWYQGYTAEEIALLPGIDLNVKGVESLLRRLTRYIRQELGQFSDKTGV